MKDCIFCKIIKKEIPAEVVYEDEKVLVFKDITPKARVHLLIIPKKHFPPINLLKKEETEIVKDLISVAKKMAGEYKIDKSGYRLIFNVGKDAGLTVEHLHLHLLGGEKLPWA
jgi:histidine triad (HIT) family protein